MPADIIYFRQPCNHDLQHDVTRTRRYAATACLERDAFLHRMSSSAAGSAVVGAAAAAVGAAAAAAGAAARRVVRITVVSDTI